MSLVHVHLKHHTRGGPNKGGGGRLARYLERVGEYDPARAIVAYNERTGGRKKEYGDFVDSGVMHLPVWAEGSAEKFFAASFEQERSNGRWATSFQANFPRAFTPEQQKTMAQAFLATHFPQRPALWVIHEPRASDGLPQPHTHLLWSERLQDGKERGPEVMFRKPEVGGCPKAVFGMGDRQAPYRLREAWCAAVNDLVTRSGYGPESLMDPRSFHTRGITRAPVKYTYDPTDIHKLDPHPPLDERTPTDRAREQQMAVDWWTTYQRSMGITRTMERQEALTIIAREVREPGARVQELQREGRAIVLDGEPFIGNVRSKIYHAPSDPSYHDVRQAQQVFFATRAEAEQAGYRPARNQHHTKKEHALSLERHEKDLAALDAYTLALDAEIAKEKAATRSNTQRPPGEQLRVAWLLAEGVKYTHDTKRLAEAKAHQARLDTFAKQLTKGATQPNPVLLRKLDHLVSVDLAQEKDPSYIPESPFHFQKDKDIDADHSR